MYKLAIFLSSLVIFTLSKTITLDNDFEDVDDVVQEKNNRHNKGLWVLKFDDDFKMNPLREPNRAELKIFKKSITPLIDTQRRHNNKISKNEVLKRKNTLHDEKGASVQEIKYELTEIINKFLLGIGAIDPTQSISSKKDKKSSFNIYFEGDDCALVLQSSRFRNVYYDSAGCTLLPERFLEEHIEHDSKGSLIRIPPEVKSYFYEKLLSLVKNLHGYAI